MKLFVHLLFFSLIIIICNNTNNTDDSNNGSETKSNVTTLSYSVINTYPHDTSSFTQGLTIWNGKLLEGTGLEQKSKLIEVDLKTGKANRQLSIDPVLFGEGITVLNDTVYQLTWRNKVVLVYSAKDFKKIKQFNINTEGWGITNDGKNLIVTDGGSNLYFYEPSTFRLLRTQSVTEDGSLSANLNELEYINGYIYANQWQYPYIVKIDPNSGQIVAKLDFTDLVNRMRSKDAHAEHLNGIAYDEQNNKIYITGKLWPELYEVQFDH